MGRDGCEGLSASQRSLFEAEGCLILRQVFGREEISRLAFEAEALARSSDLTDSLNLRCRFQTHHATGAALIDCFDPVTDIAPECAAISRDRRLLEPLRSLYGEEALLFKDKLILKAPGAGGYALHQDFIAWKGFPETFVTAVVAIDAADRANGAIEVFPGQHRRGYLSRRDGEYHRVGDRSVHQAEGFLMELAPGDVGLMGAFTPHRSAANHSDRWRRQLLLSYNAISEGGDQREAHYRHFRGWLRQKRIELGQPEGFFR